MAYKDQCDFFKAVYDDEIARLTRLTGRANLYFTIISFFLGAIVFKFNDLKDFLFLFHVPMVSYLILGLGLAAGSVFTIRAIMIHRYEGICDLIEVSQAVGSDPVAEAEFWKRRIADYALATDTNVKQNAQIAVMLKYSCYCILFSIIVQTLIIAAAIGIKVGHL